MNYSIKNILVPIDFSASADNALRLAVAMAGSHGAVIHLLNIIPTYMLPPSMEMISGSGDELALLIATSKDHVQSYKEMLIKDHQIEVVGQCEFGIVATNISAYVAKNNIDLVVMGTHGISGWKEFLIGSTAMATIKECTCPVLTVPLTYLKTAFESILYPVRTVAGVVEKYDYIRSITKKNNATIHLLGLIQKNEVNDTGVVSHMKKVIDVILNDQDIVSHETHFCQNIANKILATAHQRHADLIVINATLDADWKEFFSGGYTQQIINHANIPVLALRF